MAHPAAAHPAAAHRALAILFSAAVLFSGAVLLAACALHPTGTGGSGSQPEGSANDGGRFVQVVAAENFWGSIAAQLGGSHARVTSIVSNPDTDPHSYEPTAADARAVAGAQLVIENGIGYDPWVSKLVAAVRTNPKVLDVGNLLGVPDGGNPHRWYDPGDVDVVVAQVTSDLQQLDPADSGYFAEQAARFRSIALAQYYAIIAAIRSRYAGTPVGASESIFSMLAPSLGLKVVTPYSFLKATSEGGEVSAGDKATIDEQIKSRAIKVYVYNSQNVTPDVQVQLNEVKAEHIPYVTITETLTPPGATYQAWQTRQLLGIQAALARAVSSGR